MKNTTSLSVLMLLGLAKAVNYTHMDDQVNSITLAEEQGCGKGCGTPVCNTYCPEPDYKRKRFSNGCWVNQESDCSDHHSSSCSHDSNVGYKHGHRYEKCDIIMAHGYKEIFASSTLNVPFSWTKNMQQFELDATLESLELDSSILAGRTVFSSVSLDGELVN